VIPEPQDSVASPAQPSVPFLIILATILMLPAIHLDDHPVLHANEIDDVRTDGFLAFELIPLETMGA
jgi:hypothetical protein